MQRAHTTDHLQSDIEFDPGSDRMTYCLQLDCELAEIANLEAALDARRARCVRAIDRDETWRDLGYPTILAYLEARLCICPRTASDRLRVARALGELPMLEAALDAGEISHSTARELCRVAVAGTEREWLARARGKSQRAVEEMVRGHRKGAMPDDIPDPDLRTRKVTIEMSPATYALYRQTLSALADEAGRHVEGDEAIATMCRRSLERVGDEPPTRAPYQVAVTVCASCQRGWQDGGGAVVEIEPADVEVALCDAQHVGSIDADRPERAHQDVSPATRRLVWRRDHGRCRVDGCRSARNLDVHHVVHRADGGGHDASNVVVMCSGCHAALHRGLLEVSGSAPHYRFRHKFGVSAPVEPRSGHANDRHAGRSRSREPAERFDSETRVQARDCLTASGYTKVEATEAVDAALAHGGTFASLEELLREAFRQCSRRARE